ncbi:class I SAM-dependent methyltransferase [Spirulina sp. CCNP1310]|uniref:class I SAM-dependent methyltransferase n=1 Tax=Spirulina sp. CCNP1310 TaxID=3110249 RepID=UPI002B20DF6D|nr:class I SAM-dependent methyltransferase [Spirulina sp. CCNP1310]MEA5421216.1 class I SAM-dependent methyltransferase [Spirulina sp. CCNP1310]
MSVSEIYACRISGSPNLITVLDLGIQSLTGVFPKNKNDSVTSGPLKLVWCPDSGLLQLQHTYDLNEMYGDNYGYRSGLNSSMVLHLQQKVRYLNRICPLSDGDIVLDIGSNDATLLKSYENPGLKKLGIDPTGRKFASYYEQDIDLIPEFFSASAYRSKYPTKSAKIVTSIAMFYDLNVPKQFVEDIHSILDKDGIWHFEQSYMPTMLRMNSYDTVCHEHLEYYSLGVVKKLLEDCDLKVVDVQMNAVNGGSFAVTAARKDSQIKTNDKLIDWLLGQEERMGLHTPRPFRSFEDRVFEHRKNLLSLIRALNEDGKKVLGYGASTKGNVLLQFCGLTDQDIPCIAEVNPDKFGAYTPGTHIPIVSEEEARAIKPDYMLVLPWHFKDSIIRRESEYLANGGKLIFPLPEIEIV